MTGRRDVTRTVHATQAERDTFIICALADYAADASSRSCSLGTPGRYPVDAYEAVLPTHREEEDA
jgi:hypothetical protein